jgi:hypothetical protein
MADTTDPWAGGHASIGSSRSVIGQGRPDPEHPVFIGGHHERYGLVLR